MLNNFVIKVFDLLSWKSLVLDCRSWVCKATGTVVSGSKVTLFSSPFPPRAVFLEAVWGHEECNLCNVSSQQRSPLQLAHLHLSLKCGRALHRLHQQQLPTLPVRTLKGEMSCPTISQQSKAQGVSPNAGRWNPEKDARSAHVRHHCHKVKVDGEGSVETSFIPLDTGVTLTLPVTQMSEVQILEMGSWIFSFWLNPELQVITKPWCPACAVIFLVYCIHGNEGRALTEARSWCRKRCESEGIRRPCIYDFRKCSHTPALWYSCELHSHTHQYLQGKWWTVQQVVSHLGFI